MNAADRGPNTEDRSVTGNGRQALMQEPNSIRNPACGDRRDHGYADADSVRVKLNRTRKEIKDEADAMPIELGRCQ